MARLTGIISKLKGSAGNLTFRRDRGKTLVSEKVTETTNAKTELQLKHRMKWANIIREYQVLQPYMKLAFGGTRDGRNDYNKFVSANLMQNPVYLSKEDVNAGVCIVAPYEITHGTIKSVSVSGTGKNAVTDISLGALKISESTTLAEFSNAVVQNNNTYEYGDQITYFLLTQEVNDVTNMPLAVVDACCIVLSKSSNAKLLTLVDKRGFSMKDGYLAALETNDFGDHGMAWIHSRNHRNKTIVSTQFLICENKLLEQYQNEEAYTEAVESYGGSNNVYLTPKGKLTPTAETAKPNTPQEGTDSETGNTGKPGSDTGTTVNPEGGAGTTVNPDGGAGSEEGDGSEG